MQTMNLQIDENFYPHFKALIDSFVNDNKIKIIKKNYQLPNEVIISSVEDVKQRVYSAEKEVGMSKNEYNLTMDDFFKKEFGVSR